MSPQQIIQDMDSYVATFFALEVGDFSGVQDSDLRKALRRLHLLNAPSSTYAFLFNLFRDQSRGEEATVERGGALKMLDVIECFLFRRAICGIEPTGLHAVFKGLWAELAEWGHDAAGVQKSISRRTTVPWPRNDVFVAEVEKSNLYRRNVAKYALTELEIATEGESPEDDFEIEHIYPQNPADKWDLIESPADAEFTNSWGNLIPLSKNQNGSLGNSSYALKVSAYGQSVFATARSIAQSHPESWCVADMKSRGQKIARWALTRWPYERSIDAK